MLTIGPLPPPIGGMAAVVANLEKELGARLDHRLLNNAKTTADDRTLWSGVLAQLRLLARLVALLVGWRPTVVHIHTCSNFTFWRNGVDVLLSRLLLRPVVLHIHGGRFDEFLGALGAVRALCARRILRAAARVVVLGDEWQRRLAPWCGAERIVVISNGVPVPAQRASGSNGERLRVLCLAAYTPAKGQEELLRAASELPELELYLVGNELKSGEQRRLEQLAHELGMADRVWITGPRTGAEKDTLFDHADLFALPSHVEGLPMSMLEAMAWGLPVVVTRVGAIPEVVEPGIQGTLVKPGDVSALRDALRAWSSDPQGRRDAGERGRRLVVENYSVEAAGREIEALYRTVS
ncbi:MAG: glycosyltransferase family 4 protein [Gammaproteobacteria bacterium]